MYSMVYHRISGCICSATPPVLIFHKKNMFQYKPNLI